MCDQWACDEGACEIRQIRCTLIHLFTCYLMKIIILTCTYTYILAFLVFACLLSSHLMHIKYTTYHIHETPFHMYAVYAIISQSAGLVFERGTIELWLSTRGKVCPITHEVRYNAIQCDAIRYQAHRIYCD